jgi:hypothetical protein
MLRAIYFMRSDSEASILLLCGNTIGLLDIPEQILAFTGLCGAPTSEVITLAQTSYPSRHRLSQRGKIMPIQSAKKPPQFETRTKENLNLPEWKAPSLADLLQRLSVNSANASLKS